MPSKSYPLSLPAGTKVRKSKAIALSVVTLQIFQGESTYWGKWSSGVGHVLAKCIRIPK